MEKLTTQRINKLRENEAKNPILRKTNFEIEEALFLKIKRERKENFVSQRKLVNEILKLGLKEYQLNKYNI